MKTYSIDRQFLWGKGLLVTPVVDPGVDYVVGYFPAGLWYDYYTVSLPHSHRHSENNGAVNGVMKGIPFFLMSLLVHIYLQ